MSSKLLRPSVRARFHGFQWRQHPFNLHISDLLSRAYCAPQRGIECATYLFYLQGVSFRSSPHTWWTSPCNGRYLLDLSEFPTDQGSFPGYLSRILNTVNTPFQGYFLQYWGVHRRRELSVYPRSLTPQLLQEYGGNISVKPFLAQAKRISLEDLGTSFRFSGLPY